MQNSQLLILLRGLPGSGKTFIAQQLSEDNKYPIFSIDDYFTDKISGQYQFDFSKNHLAYKQCEEQTKMALMNGFRKVIVHNPFVLEWEIEPYFKMAQSLNCAVAVMTVEKHHNQENVHQIQLSQIEKMAAKFKVKLF